MVYTLYSIVFSTIQLHSKLILHNHNHTDKYTKTLNEKAFFKTNYIIRKYEIKQFIIDGRKVKKKLQQSVNYA